LRVTVCAPAKNREAKETNYLQTQLPRFDAHAASWLVSDSPN
jgi:hypothetical protein